MLNFLELKLLLEIRKIVECDYSGVLLQHGQLLHDIDGRTAMAKMKYQTHKKTCYILSYGVFPMGIWEKIDRVAQGNL